MIQKEYDHSLIKFMVMTFLVGVFFALVIEKLSTLLSLDHILMGN